MRTKFILMIGVFVLLPLYAETEFESASMFGKQSEIKVDPLVKSCRDIEDGMQYPEKLRKSNDPYEAPMLKLRSGIMFHEFSNDRIAASSFRCRGPRSDNITCVSYMRMDSYFNDKSGCVAIYLHNYAGPRKETDIKVNFQFEGIKANLKGKKWNIKDRGMTAIYQFKYENLPDGCEKNCERKITVEVDGGEILWGIKTFPVPFNPYEDKFEGQEELEAFRAELDKEAAPFKNIYETKEKELFALNKLSKEKQYKGKAREDHQNKRQKVIGEMNRADSKVREIYAKEGEWVKKKSAELRKARHGKSLVEEAKKKKQEQQ